MMNKDEQKPKKVMTLTQISNAFKERGIKLGNSIISQDRKKGLFDVYSEESIAAYLSTRVIHPSGAPLKDRNVSSKTQEVKNILVEYLDSKHNNFKDFIKGKYNLVDISWF